jgi:single-stranded-DNA-specific exonuclease
MANPEPTFLTKNLTISDIRIVGRDGKHLKIKFQIPNSKFQIGAIAFGAGDNHQLKIGDKVDVVYTVEENNWNGNSNVELKVKDLNKN